ncbi:hypothetical protein [Pseudomonas putida]|uniref:hypothetical protein n=1 Tax=Pseudomonas putida TaxID=303 RepID=UPI003D961522
MIVDRIAAQHEADAKRSIERAIILTCDDWRVARANRSLMTMLWRTGRVFLRAGFLRAAQSSIPWTTGL